MDEYANYYNLKRDLSENRLQTKTKLKEFFNQNKDENKAKTIIRTLVHGLADPDLPEKDKYFFQAVLYSKPELTTRHLIGGLKVGHKTPEGGLQRVQAIKKILVKKKLSENEQNVRKLVASLDDPEVAGHISNVLAHPNYANELTAVTLISSLAGKQNQHASEILSTANYGDDYLKVLQALVLGTSSSNEKRQKSCLEILKKRINEPHVKEYLKELLDEKIILTIFEGKHTTRKIPQKTRSLIMRLLEINK
ncbi:hypothetical protein HUU53_03505 [Candidatus Micrarchaeota archaeon]|nr:hypothetical protein [Candidatus Micrarchaeota archaeon]